MRQENGVAKYYSRLGSWAGYNLVMGRSQHAGYWTKLTKNERQAQANYLEKLREYLDLKEGYRVLDAGSGQGYAARYLAEKTGADITGITITPREVAVSSKLSRNTPNRPKFILGDYSATDFPDEYFDVVYTTETLSHAKDISAVMREFYRIVRPGGKVVLADYEVDTARLSHSKKIVINFLLNHAGGHGLYQQNPGQIAAAMRRAGFSDIREEDWSKYTKPTFDRLRRIARPFSWIKPMSKLAPYFVNAVMASHFYSNWYEDGSFRYLIYTGRKG